MKTVTKETRTYVIANKSLNGVEVSLANTCIKMLLHDESPVQCATYVTDILERFLIQFSDDMSITHKELFTLMYKADKIETRLYGSLGLNKPTR